MTRRADFTQAQVKRLIKAANALGKTVAAHDGMLVVVDRIPISESQAEKRDPKAPVEAWKGMAL